MSDFDNQEVERLSEHLKVAVSKDGTFKFYVTLDGLGDIEIRKLNVMLFQRWLRAKQMARPKPPLKKIQLGTREHWQPDSEDPYWLQEKEIFDVANSYETSEYMIQHSAVLRPPDDYVLTDELAQKYMFTEDERPLAWLYEKAEGTNYIDILSDAIQSLMAASEEEIQHHIKSFKSDGEQ